MQIKPGRRELSVIRVRLHYRTRRPRCTGLDPIRHFRLWTLEFRTPAGQMIRNGSRGNVRTTLETLARKAAVKVESMEPQASPAHDVYRETKVEIELKGKRVWPDD